MGATSPPNFIEIGRCLPEAERSYLELAYGSNQNKGGILLMTVCTSAKILLDLLRQDDYLGSVLLNLKPIYCKKCDFADFSFEMTRLIYSATLRKLNVFRRYFMAKGVLLVKVCVPMPLTGYETRISFAPFFIGPFR